MYELDKARNELLRKAQEVLDTYGWVQGRDGDPEMGFCAIGALAKAREELRDQARYNSESLQSGYYSALDALQELAALEGSRTVIGLRTLSGWNDSPCRTKQEVIDLLSLAFIPGSIPVTQQAPPHRLGM